jgi:hypothetical protein
VRRRGWIAITAVVVAGTAVVVAGTAVAVAWASTAASTAARADGGLLGVRFGDGTQGDVRRTARPPDAVGDALGEPLAFNAGLIA